ncbi:MAG: DUF3179 domain-containing protein [Oceanipulchritudo sp.]
MNGKRGMVAGLLLLGTISLSAKPEMNGFDLGNAVIPAEEILSGGPPRDGIPSIDRPVFESVEEADRWLKKTDLVVSLEMGGEIRAYPLRILVWHEIVNDRFGEQPVAVTYCPLCGTAMVFDALIGGITRTFGVSGLLYNSDVLMYDRQTESLWSQLAMKALSGPALGNELELMPSEHLEWETWKAENPSGRVLSRETGTSRNYGRMPYSDYEQTDRTMFPVKRYRDELKNKEWIIGLHVNGLAAAFPLQELKDQEMVKARVGTTLIEVIFDPERGTVKATQTESGETIPVTRAYWFAWQAFYPETALWRAQ